MLEARDLIAQVTEPRLFALVLGFYAAVITLLFVRYAFRYRALNSEHTRLVTEHSAIRNAYSTQLMEVLNKPKR